MDAILKLKEDLNRNEEIKMLLESGCSVKKISEVYNVSIGLPEYLKNNFEDVQGNLKNKISYYERVVMLFLKGSTVTKIAELEGTTKQNISRILKLCNVNRKDGGSSKTKSLNLAQVKKLHEEGLSLEDITLKLDFDEMKVRHYAYEMGIDLKTDTELRVNKQTDLVVILRENGKTQKEIADYLGISQAYVSKILLGEDMRVRKTREEYILRDDKIYSDYCNGLVISELVDKYNLSELNIRRIITKFTSIK